LPVWRVRLLTYYAVKEAMQPRFKIGRHSTREENIMKRSAIIAVVVAIATALSVSARSAETAPANPVTQV
jgi:hypothetical protein